jgi:hypothetical protein
LNCFANTQSALKRRANLTAPLGGGQTAQFDPRGLQFASPSPNLPKHNDFNAAFLTAQEILGVKLKVETML